MNAFMSPGRPRFGVFRRPFMEWNIGERLLCILRYSNSTLNPSEIKCFSFNTANGTALYIKCPTLLLHGIAPSLFILSLKDKNCISGKTAAFTVI